MCEYTLETAETKHNEMIYRYSVIRTSYRSPSYEYLSRKVIKKLFRYNLFN